MTAVEDVLIVVIKVGSSSILDEATYETRISILKGIVSVAVNLLRTGHQVIIVSSGAVAAGRRRVGEEYKRLSPSSLAAIGQCHVSNTWVRLFEEHCQPVAQILLNRHGETSLSLTGDTLRELMHAHVIPIVNENDAVATNGTRFGDNDTLSASIAAIVKADILFLVTDVDCLYDKDPRIHLDAQPIEIVNDIDSLREHSFRSKSSLGTGGMTTKIAAARIAASNSVTTIIMSSTNSNGISQIIYRFQLERRSEPFKSPSTHQSLPLHTRILPAHE